MMAVAFCALCGLGALPLNLPTLRLVRPSAGDVDAFIARQAGKRFNTAAPPGVILAYLSTGDRPLGLRLCERSVCVGRGQRAYDRAQRALVRGELFVGVNWAFIRFGDGRAPREASDLATVVKCYRCAWCLNPCRVTHVSARTTRSTVAYATLEGHLLEGEEAFDLQIGVDGTVRLRVASLSRGSGALGVLASPFIAPIRRAFLAAAVRSFAAAVVADDGAAVSDAR
jgi:uncharacterized protein (UPF0548 family)